MIGGTITAPPTEPKKQMMAPCRWCGHQTALILLQLHPKVTQCKHCHQWQCPSCGGHHAVRAAEPVETVAINR